jgi:starch-binding outer membrane protein, SusD/RagB family
MNKILKYLFVILLLAAPLVSCKDEFLETENLNSINADTYPTRATQIELEMGSVYGFRTGKSFFFYFPMATFGQEHWLTDAKTNVGWFILTQTSGLLYRSNQPEQWGNNPYNLFYQTIRRANSVLESIKNYRSRALPEEEALLNHLEGEALINRAVEYYYLAGYYSEALPSNGQFQDALGVPLRDALPKSLNEINEPRATVKETYEFIAQDLLRAIELLGDHQWPLDQPARFNALGARALLGKVYVLLENWPQAKTTLESVINNPKAQLLPYDQYKAMWVDGNNKYNSEVLLAVNSPSTRNDSWEDGGFMGLQRFIGPSYFMPKESDPTKFAGRGAGGWGMAFYPDQNIKRFGFDIPLYTTSDAPDANYISKSLQARNNKTVDPRLWVNAFQMWVDTLKIDGVKRPVGYHNEMVAEYVGRYHVFNARKYMDTEFSFTGSPTYFQSRVNFPIIRIADVYLLYAETLIRGGGDQALALEYINKVKRRAYGFNPNSPEPSVDYKSLSDPTKAPAEDKVLSNNPLRYERWAELQGEASWWLDVKRWRLAKEETDYYKFTTADGGTNLVWQDFKYAWPIPTSETEPSGGAVKQNPGY